MINELRFLVGVPASALHAAAALARGAALVDARLAGAISPGAQAMSHTLAALGLDARAWYEQLLPLSVHYEAPAELVRAALAKLSGREVDAQAAAALAQCVARLESDLVAAFPRALEELELRSAPLREQWEACGPGLLSALAQLIQPELIVPQADAILVQPALGGGGAAHPCYNSVRIEAVLANPIDALPEVVRLGWLVAQLNLDMPDVQGDLDAADVARVGSLALIPPIVEASQQVELARFAPQTIATAVSAWTDEAADVERLVEWWETYKSSRPDWAVALGALKRMLDGSND